MTFEEANDIISRRYCYRMKDIPTDDEIKEVKKAFGIHYGSLCYRCGRYDGCHMAGADTLHCNFFTEGNP